VETLNKCIQFVLKFEAISEKSASTLHYSVELLTHSVSRNVFPNVPK